MVLKHCIKCNEDKVPSRFHRDERYKDGRSSYCKTCHNKVALKHSKTEKGKKTKNKAQKKYRKTKKGKRTQQRYYGRHPVESVKGPVLVKHKNSILKRKYGITLKEYEQIFKAQNGVCAVCGNPENQIDKRYGTKKRLAVDHDHKTEKVRGLLCMNCNCLLGKIQDNPTLLRSVINYLGCSVTS